MVFAVARDLNDVVIFTKVVEARSFTAAAKALGVPTSTVSRRVSRLEEELGVRLLQRTTRKLSVTEAGQAYYERGARLVAELEDVENMLAESRATPRGRVRLIAPVEHTITVRMITEFLIQHPEVRVEAEFADRDVNIIQDGYDASIHVGPVSNLSVIAHKLFDSAFHIVASPAYLEREGAPTTVAELADHDCLILGPSSLNAVWTLRQGDDEARVSVRGRLAVNHLQGVCSAALAGLGVALLPRVVCGRLIERGDLLVLLPDATPSSVPIYITYPGGKYLAPAVRAFVDFVREHFSAVAGETT